MKRLNCRRKGIRVRILAIDTSNQTLSIAVCENQKILGSYTATVKRNHSLTLMPAIDYLMSQLNLAPTAIDRFVVAEGPGSYTGFTFRRDDCQNIGLYFKERASRHFQSTNVSCQLCWTNWFNCASFDARVVKRLCWCLSVCQWRVAK